VVAAATSFWLVACSPVGALDPTPPTPTPAGPVSTVTSRLAGGRTVVDGLVQAVRDHDRSTFDSLIADRDPSFADRTRLLYTNLAGLPLTELRMRLDPAAHPVSVVRQKTLGADAWVQRATVTWRLSGDSGAAEQIVWLTFVDHGGVRLAGTRDIPPGAAPSQQPSWWLGPVTAVRGGDVTAIAGVGQSAQRWADRGAAAVRQVHRLLPTPAARSWDGRIVLEAPATPGDFEAVLGAPAGTRAGIAAVAQPEGPNGTAAIRVVVNPRATELLSRSQLSRVLVHEIVHVATRAPDSAAPIWIVEGLAEWVSLRDRPGERSWGTAGLLRTVRADGSPQNFPNDTAFTVGAANLNRAYAEAWLGCRFIADRYSAAKMAAFYAELDRGRTLDQASWHTLGIGESGLVKDWRDYLSRLARQG
jgi:hypothetical protein